ncbi:MAG: phenylacetate--CoA ligase family protein [Candidatus Staskawiczbacteria bacterium]|nr:phenylacetate--CoA ligase family protein [Candidatus Staskawiczbacteria bacterium]
MKSQSNTNTSTIIKLIRHNGSEFWDLEKRDSNYWSSEQKKRSLTLFHKASEYVPAYRDFLKKNHLNPEKIKTWEEFQKVPIVSKKEYLKQYLLKNLCWNGHLKKPLVFTSTSGSTGEPFYFPRGRDLDWQYSLLIEEFLKNSLKKSNGPTLVIICFGMGVWIGGLITYKAFEMATQRVDIPVSIITPGINKKEIFNALKNLLPHFENAILVGYPPFIKDIVDESSSNEINLKKLNLKLIFAAEAFTEKFRDYLVEKTGIKNPYVDTMNIYGTADIGAMAYETPLSILIRRIASKKPNLFKDIFGSINKTPTLAQFNPLFINFECVDGNIFLTGNNEIPLVRYSVGDHGGVYSYDEMTEILKRNNIDINQETKKVGIENVSSELPFVFVFERNDFSLTLYGLQIYPEPIRETILEKPFDKFLSSKFTMLTKFNKKQNQYLEINIELKKYVDAPRMLKKHLSEKILDNLRHKNSEFRELSDYLKSRVHPKIVFWKNGSQEFFAVGNKQKWVKK